MINFKVFHKYNNINQVLNRSNYKYVCHINNKLIGFKAFETNNIPFKIKYFSVTTYCGSEDS